MHIAWSEIEASLHTVEKANGGFSKAHRGLITLADGRRIFVKMGVDDTKKWAKKEVETYRFLQRNNFPFIPSLLSYSEDETCFALEALTQGWDWSENWTGARLQKTLEAMDALAAITPTGADRDYFSQKTFGQDNNGWVPLSDSPELQQLLLDRLRMTDHDEVASSINFAAEAERSARFVFADDVLVHSDVRSDNAAWNTEEQIIKIVDWDWTHLGDRRIDLARMLVSAQKSGLDVTISHGDRLDSDALHWLAGSWFKSATAPIWPGGPAHLRDHQMDYAIVALDLARKLQS